MVASGMPAKKSKVMIARTENRLVSIESPYHSTKSFNPPNRQSHQFPTGQSDAAGCGLGIAADNHSPGAESWNRGSCWRIPEAADPFAAEDFDYRVGSELGRGATQLVKGMLPVNVLLHVEGFSIGSRAGLDLHRRGLGPALGMKFTIAFIGKTGWICF